jgi:predicted dehydrogenase
MRPDTPPESSPNRRSFLRTTAAGTTAALGLEGALAAGAHAGGDDAIRVALVGCGGRGTGAAVNALGTAGPKRLVALADLFPDRLRSSLEQLLPEHAADVDVPPDRQFLGMDAYRHAIDAVAPGGLVLLATPPAFRPIHVEYAISRGCHVFMEKSFGVDVPGVRRILAAGEVARQKNLKIAGGLMSRHSPALAEAVEQIHNGAIGDVITCYAYRMHGPVGFRPRSEGETELEHQIRNYSNFTWLNGSFILDWLIHNLDVCCWIKGAWPESAQAQGGRQVRTEPDQLFDHLAVEYTFPDGTRLVAQGRHILECWDFFGDVIHGTTGSAVLGEGITDPKLYRGHRPVPENVLWRYKGKPANAYQVEHDRLFRAIREGTPYNEAERCAHAALTGILGRMAIESGGRITWEEALASTRELAPGLDRLTLDSPAPVQPDAAGHYPIAMPGTTRVL